MGALPSEVTGEVHVQSRQCRVDPRTSAAAGALVSAGRWRVQSPHEAERESMQPMLAHPGPVDLARGEPDNGR